MRRRVRAFLGGVSLLAGASKPEALGEVHHLNGEVALRGGGRRRCRLASFFLFLRALCRLSVLFDARSSHQRLHRFVELVLLEVEDHILHAFVVALGSQVVVRLQLPGQAVHEGVVQDAPLELVGGKAACLRPGIMSGVPSWPM